MLGSAAVYAVQLGCVVSGTILARRRPEHRPIAALMALGLAVDVALELAPPFAVRVALGTCYPWAAWAVARGVLGGKRGPWRGYRSGFARLSLGGIPLAFALFVCAILATGVRGPALARCYAAAQLFVALGCGRAVWRWQKLSRGAGRYADVHQPGCGLWSTLRRPSRGLRCSGARSELPSQPEPTASRPLSATVACALVVAFVEMANVPAYLGLPNWTSARAVYALGFVVVLVGQAAAIIRR